MTSEDVFSVLILFNEQAIKSSLLALSGPNIAVLIHPHAIQEKKKKKQEGPGVESKNLINKGSVKKLCNAQKILQMELRSFLPSFSEH